MDINSLLNPINEHPINKRPQKCSWNGCKKAFSRKHDLKRHLKIHTGERPFRCDWQGCGKLFRQRSALKVHSRIHSGERPYICKHPNCSMSFSDVSVNLSNFNIIKHTTVNLFIFKIF